MIRREDKKKRREFVEKIGSNTEALSLLNNENDPDATHRKKLQQTIYQQQRNLEIFESSLIIRKARSRGIEIPAHRDKPFWWADDAEEGMPGYAITFWLNELGRTSVNKLIRKEWKENVEWWVKIVTPLLGVLISLLGLTVALVTVLKSSSR